MAGWEQLHGPAMRCMPVEGHCVLAACGSAELSDDGIGELQPVGISRWPSARLAGCA